MIKTRRQSKSCHRARPRVPPLTERTDLMTKMTTEHLLRLPMAYLTDVSRFEGMAQVWAHQIQMCLQWQADMFKAAGPFATRWFERQLEAAYSVLENIEKFARCGDLTGAVAIQRQWSEAAGKRLTAEPEKLTDQATSPRREAVSASRDAMVSVAEGPIKPKRSAAQEKAGEKKAKMAIKTKAASQAKTAEAKIESTGEAKIESAVEAKIESAGEAKIETVGDAETEAAAE